MNHYDSDTAHADTDAATEVVLHLPAVKRRKRNDKRRNERRRQDTLREIDHLRHLVETADVQASASMMDTVRSCVEKCISTINALSVTNMPAFVTDKPDASTELWNKLTDKQRRFYSTKKAGRTKTPAK